LLIIFQTIYNLLWLAAMPLLKRSPRISLGWRQRTLKEFQPGPYDLWIQGASGGESMLTAMVIAELSCSLGPDRAVTILATSGTKQGIEALQKAEKKRRQAHPAQFDRVRVTIAYFPFDAPRLMKKAFKQFVPKVAVLVETELWPGFLVEAKKSNIPVLLINGRMSEKSYRSYRRLGFFFSRYGPDRVYAISELDGGRFAGLIGSERVEIVNNIKFDQLSPATATYKEESLISLLPLERDFVVLGSVRKEEEQLIATTVVDLLRARPDLSICIFPKHVERADNWLELLGSYGVSALKRSRLKEFRELKQGKDDSRVIIWDTFGELAGAYGQAKTAFVGGSLSNWGGHNFLEPLVSGLRPVIGPNWKNFAWIGRGIIDCGLVTEVEDAGELTRVLLERIDEHADKEKILEQVHNYLAPRMGGTRQVCRKIAQQLYG
jgi:3-deoxy-D-manno-octulosonic-acid transferase